MITFKVRGDLKNTITFLNESKRPFSQRFLHILKKYGEKGVYALQAATPVDSGKTASSWWYEIIQNRDNPSIVFHNDNVNHGVNIAIILQYGHGTRNGGYVQGRDYINPAIQPVFDSMIEEIWKEAK